MSKDTLNKTLIILAGPTSSGKTDVAISLARKLQTGIINADSRQIYKELVIGVGRPAQEQLALAPHYLVGHVSILDDYSTGKFEQDALNVLDTLFEDNNEVILTGGTGLYIQSILRGLDQLPAVDESIRKEWEQRFKEEGIEPLQKTLIKIDPVYAGKVDMQNPMRLLRGITVTLSSGVPYSAYLGKEGKQRDFNSLLFYLQIDRDKLYQKINTRVEAMIASGWIEECIDLLPFKGKKSLQTIGYKEIFEWLEQPYPKEELIERIKQSTRRYAKRQETWFRHHETWIVLDGSESAEKLSNEIIHHLMSNKRKI